MNYSKESPAEFGRPPLIFRAKREKSKGRAIRCNSSEALMRFLRDFRSYPWRFNDGEAVPLKMVTAPGAGKPYAV